jgi:hypothetical protein
MKAWWDFVGAATRSPQYQKILAIGLTFTGGDARRGSSSRTVGVMLLQIWSSFAQARPPTVCSTARRAMSGSSWVTQLKSAGVAMHLEATVELAFDGTDHRSQRHHGGRISARSGRLLRRGDAARTIPPLVTPAMIQKAPSFAPCPSSASNG